MAIMKQLRQRATVELVPRGHSLNVIATAASSCQVTMMSRMVGVDPGTPIAVDADKGFTVFAPDDYDYAYKIEALTDDVVYFQVSKGRETVLIIGQEPPAVPAE